MQTDLDFRKALISCFQSAFFVLFLLGIYFVHVPWNIQRLNISESQLGIGILVFGVANFIFNQITGRVLIPKFGTKNSMLFGIIIFSASPLLLVSALDYTSFLISWIPLGIGIGLFMPSAQTQISLIELKAKRILTPLFQASFSCGALFGALISGYLISYITDPRITFALIGLFGLISSWVIYLIGLPNHLDPKDKVEKFSFPKFNIFIFGIMLMFFYASIGIIIDWSALWLTKDLMAPLYLGGLVIIFFNLGEIISRLMAERLIKYLGEIFVGGYLAILSSLILAIAITTLDLKFIIPGIFIFGFGTANFISVVIVGAIKISDQTLSITVSNLITIGFAGFIFGPAIVGFLAEYYGLTFNMYLLCSIWILNASLLIYMIKKNKVFSN